MLLVLAVVMAEVVTPIVELKSIGPKAELPPWTAEVASNATDPPNDGVEGGVGKELDAAAVEVKSAKLFGLIGGGCGCCLAGVKNEFILSAFYAPLRARMPTTSLENKNKNQLSIDWNLFKQKMLIILRDAK